MALKLGLWAFVVAAMVPAAQGGGETGGEKGNGDLGKGNDKGRGKEDN
jgi:hypothetical protein